MASLSEWVHHQATLPVTRTSPVPIMILLMSAGPAAAQVEEARAAVRADRQALEEIVVTAERRSRSLIDTATSVAVLTAADLEDSGALQNTEDVFSQIPNVTASGANFAPSVRGVDGTGPANGGLAFVAGTRSRLNVQIDGRPATYNEIVYGQSGIWDVEQIEVLRGPQSALQGRNAIGGTMVVKTRDPTYDPEIRLRALGGNQNTQQYSGAFSTGLVDEQMAFRVAVDHAIRETYVHPAASIGAFDDPRHFENTTIRGKLLIEPKSVDDLSAMLTVNHTSFRGLQGEVVIQPYEDFVDAWQETNAVWKPESTAGILDLDWGVSENLELHTIVSYSDINIDRYTEPNQGRATVDGTQLKIEPSISCSSTDGDLTGIAGVYFFDAEQADVLDFGFLGEFDDETRNLAGFFEGTYAFSERFDVTLGARYEVEDRRRVGALGPFIIDFDDTYREFMPKIIFAWHPNEGLTFGVFAARGYNGGSAGINFFPPFNQYTFDIETVWNYEMFARALLADGRVSLTGNVFFSDYDGMQLPFMEGQNTIVRNADKVETYGSELSVSWQIVPSLLLSTGLGLLDTEIKEFPASGIQGNELPRAPSVTGHLSVDFAHPGGADFGLNARYSDAYWSEPTQQRGSLTESYWLVDAYAGYRFNERVRLFAFANNLFDTIKPLLKEVSVQTGFTELDAAVITRPRHYGIGLQVDY